MKPKAILFDLDDTLYSNFSEGDNYGYECMGAYAEKELGVQKDIFIKALRTCRKRLGRRQPGMPPTHNRLIVAQHALEQFGKNAIRHAGRLHRIYWDALFTKIIPRSEVPPLLSELRTANIKTVVCTDMLADIQMEKLVYLGLADSIDYLVSSEEAGIDKPAAPIFWLALHKCACLPHEAIMVGDNFIHDVQGALDLGIGAVWLNCTNQPHPEEERSYFEARTFAEAAEYIRQNVNQA